LAIGWKWEVLFLDGNGRFCLFHLINKQKNKKYHSAVRENHPLFSFFYSERARIAKAPFDGKKKKKQISINSQLKLIPVPPPFHPNRQFQSQPP
jgi:hypothetical protein